MKYITTSLKSEITTQERLFEDLKNIYLSKTLIDLIRTYYTEKERKKLIENRKQVSIPISDCEPDWPICFHKLLHSTYFHKSPSFYLYKEKDLLRNFKADHFCCEERTSRKVFDHISVRCTSPVMVMVQDEETGSLLKTKDCSAEDSEKKDIENQLLIERQSHDCKFKQLNRDQEIEKRRWELRKQIDFTELKELGPNSTRKRTGSMGQSQGRTHDNSNSISSSSEKILLGTMDEATVINEVADFGGFRLSAAKFKKQTSPGTLESALNNKKEKTQKEAGEAMGEKSLKGSVVEHNTYEIESDDESDEDEEGLPTTRDMVKRLTFMVGNMAKLNITEDLMSFSALNSVLHNNLNMSKFHFKGDEEQPKSPSNK